LFNYLEKRRKALVFIPLIVYWIILFTATTLPMKELPSIALGDKVNHFSAYLLLSVMLFLTLIFQRRNILLQKYAAQFALLIASVYGVLDEIHQLFIPGRSAEVLDWAADTGGALIGVIIITILMKKYKYQPRYNQ